MPTPEDHYLPPAKRSVKLLILWMLAITTFCCTGSWFVGNHYVEEQHTHALQVATLELERAIVAELDHYAIAIESARGLFAASESVTREEWNAFINSKNTQANYPGIYGFAYLRAVNHDDIPDFLASVREDDAPDFQIQSLPGHEDRRPAINAIITYYEPEPLNRPVLGLNVTTRPETEQTIEKTLLSGELQITPPLMLHGRAKEERWGAVLLLPVFQKNKPTETVAERRVAIQGWVAAAISFERFFQLGTIRQYLRDDFDACVIAEDAASNPQTLFCWHRGRATSPEGPQAQTHSPLPEEHAAHTEIEFASRHWTLATQLRPQAGSLLAYLPATATMGGGLLAGLINAVIWSLMRTRSRAEALARRQTASLRQSELFLQKTQQIANIGGWELNLETETVYWTKEVYRIHEVPDTFAPTLENAVGFYHPDDIPKISDAVQHAAATGQGFDLTLRLITAKERTLWVRAIGEAQWERSSVVSIYGTFQDVTQQKNAELQLADARDNAEQASRAKSDFLANMSHEIRTPMTAILGFSDVLLDPQADTSDKLNAARTIQRSGSHLLDLLNSILDVSKIEAGRLETLYSDIDTKTFLHDILHLFEQQALDRAIGLELTMATPIPATLHTDGTRLKQAFVNLLSNAVKFTHEGDVNITLSYDEKTHALTTRVRDTGTGMNPETLTTLFKPFTQADASTTRRFGGTGLGLAITRHIAHLLGGRIEVESEVGRGSTFTLTIIARPAGPQPEARVQYTQQTPLPLPNTTDGVATPPTLNGRRVLLVEDGPDNQRLIRFLLKKAGADVEIATNGQESLGFFSADTGPAIDLVLMDMQMPVMDGYEATERLRADGVATPIIALTAHAMIGEEERCLSAGCDRYLTKPVEQDKLIHTILEMLPAAS